MRSTQIKKPKTRDDVSKIRRVGTLPFFNYSILLIVPSQTPQEIQ
jgi:hypothetical protein